MLRSIFKAVEFGAVAIFASILVKLVLIIAFVALFNWLAPFNLLGPVALGLLALAVLIWFVEFEAGILTEILILRFFRRQRQSDKLDLQ